MSTASLFTLELQTDRQLSHHLPVNTTELSVGSGSYIKLWSAAVCMCGYLCYFSGVTAARRSTHIDFFIAVCRLTLRTLFISRPE